MRRIFTLVVAGFFAIGAAAEARPPAANGSGQSAAPKDKVICKRFTRIGSLVDSYRTCKTKSEWDRERENLQQVNWASPCKQAESGTCE